jgi:thymidylate synthase (FAD)
MADNVCAEVTEDEKSFTSRVTVQEIEELLYKPIKILDHGFVRIIDYMGNDNSIVQAARVSYGKGTKQVNQDRGLIRYLMRHYHTTPFEMCDIKFHIKLPIFIARQWIRHRTASVNEYSARYSILSKEFYIPNREHLAAQSNTNNQGRGNLLSENEADRVLEILLDDANKCYDHYSEMLNLDEAGNIIDDKKDGLARELARMNLTLNYYTEWYWKVNLHNLLHFLHLRADPHAQYEIRVYAQAMLDIVKKWVPFTHEAFMDYRANAVSLSAPAVNIVKKLISGEKITQETSGLSKREWDELMQSLSLENIGV